MTFPPDPVPTVAAGIEATVQRGLLRMQAAGIQAVPIGGPCGASSTRRATLLGLCFSCAHYGPEGSHTLQPRIVYDPMPSGQAQPVARCLEHLQVHGGSVTPAQGVPA